jgi:dCMP deaminase
MVRLAASKSKDTSTKIGAVIVGKSHEVRSLGYNGMPRGADDNNPARHERPLKYRWFEHGERNAIYNAARVGIPTDGCTMYTNAPPCTDCARAIVQAGIAEVVVEHESPPHWQADCAIGKEILAEGGVQLRFAQVEELPEVPDAVARSVPLVCPKPVQ